MDQDLSDVGMTVEKAREILGKTAESMSDEELQKQMTMLKYLAESWLDEYEKTIFEGKTLNELISS